MVSCWLCGAVLHADSNKQKFFPPFPPQRHLKTMQVVHGSVPGIPQGCSGLCTYHPQDRQFLMQKLGLTRGSMWHMDYLPFFPKALKACWHSNMTTGLVGRQPFLLPKFLFLRNCLFDFVCLEIIFHPDMLWRDRNCSKVKLKHIVWSLSVVSALPKMLAKSTGSLCTCLVVFVVNDSSQSRGYAC